MKIKKLLFLFISLFLVIGLMPVASALDVAAFAYWDAAGKPSNLIATQGETVKYVVGATSTSHTGAITMQVDLYKKGTYMYNLYKEYSKETSLYKQLSVDTTNLKGEYTIINTLTSSKGKDTQALYLNVKEKTTKGPYVFMSWSNQNTGKDDKAIIVGDKAQFAYVGSSVAKTLKLDIDLYQGSTKVADLVDKSAQDSVGTMFITGGHALGKEVAKAGNYVVRATATDNQGKSSVYSLSLTVSKKAKPAPTPNPNPKPTPKPKSTTKYAPEFKALSSPSYVVDEGKNVILNPTATDKNSADKITLKAQQEVCILWGLICTYHPLPAEVAFTDKGDGTSVFAFVPDYDFVKHPAKNKLVRFVITASDGDSATKDAEQKFTIMVNDVNQGPYLAEYVAERNGQVGKIMTFTLNGKDADTEDQSTLKLTSSNLPSGSTFVDQGQGKGTFSWTPTKEGSVHVTFQVTDQMGASKSYQMELKIAKGTTTSNQDPVLNPIGNKEVTAGTKLVIPVSASDADKDKLTLKTSALPKGATFKDNGDGTGSFSWIPESSQVGTIFKVNFGVFDTKWNSDSEVVTIQVKKIEDKVNVPPVLVAIGNKQVEAESKLSFAVKGTDDDKDKMVLKTSQLPTGAVFKDNGDGTGVFTWTPTQAQGGKLHYVIFEVTDIKGGSDYETVTIEVNSKSASTTPKPTPKPEPKPEPKPTPKPTGKNTAPELAFIGTQVVKEGQTLKFTIKASDVDNDKLNFEASNLPSGASFKDNRDGTGTFVWTPTYIQSGVYSNVLFGVSDGNGGEDKEFIAIAVIDVSPTTTPKPTPTPTPNKNNDPVLTSIGNKIVTEGETLKFKIVATDVDGDSLSLEGSNLPSGSSFKDLGKGIGFFTWTPTLSQAGVYTKVLFGVSDGFGGGEDKEFVSITVLDANRGPQIISTPAKVATKNKEYSYPVKVSDADNDAVKYELVYGPSKMSFTDNVLSWKPKSQGKACAMIKVTETKTSEPLSDTQHWCIQVNEVEKELKFMKINLFNEYVTAGDYLMVNVGLANTGDDLTDVKIKAVVYELGIVKSTTLFDLDDGKSITKNLYLEIPADAQAGEYYVRVIASNDEITHIAHRVFVVQ